MTLVFVVSALVFSSFLEVKINFFQAAAGLLVFLILSAVASAAFSYRFASPMRQVILKALRIANKKQVADLDEVEEILEDEPGEYFELEMALNKIRRKMKKRRLQLSHEREESQALMASLDDAILSVGPDLKIKFFNSRMVHQFLEQAQTELLQKAEPVPLARIIREPEILKLYQQSLLTGETQVQSLRLYSLLHHQHRYFSVKVSPLREEKVAKIYGAMGLFHDITELKKADQIRIEFVENASHELRTPLTSIKGFVETAKDDLAAGRTDQLAHFLAIISKNVDRLTELVSDMLTLTSLDADTAFRREQINPHQLTEEIVERLSPLANEKNLLIQMSFEAVPFQADHGKVAQVLENLLSNAIKYIPPEKKIEIRWDEEGRFVRLQIIDNGPGIADIHQTRLFERFYRVDKGRSRDVGGTGLGLSIVKHIMQSHGGSVHLKSQIGQGCQFTCLFPK